MQRMRAAQLDARSPAAYLLLAVFVAGSVGYLLARGGQLGLLATVAAFALLVFLIRPINLAIFALLTLYAVQRVGGTSSTAGSSGGVSYSDAVLTGAAIMALLVLVGTDELRRLRAPLVGLGIYLACLLPTVIFNPTGRGELEFVHRVVLVGGAMLVGAWLARERYVDHALRAMVVFSALLATATFLYTVRNGFTPASPLDLNKNLVGSMYAVMIVVVLAVPHRLKMSVRWRVLAFVGLGAGLGAAQSRGALIAAALGMFLTVIVSRGLASRASKLLATLIAIVIGIGVYLSVESQLTSSQSNTNALGVRFNVEKETRKIWRTSPIDGVGLKYFNQFGKYGEFAQAPNNVVDNELAESGVIGLAGFTVLQGSVMLIGFARRRDRLAVVGAAVVVGQLVHGMVDIYWSAGVTALPFVMLGMGLAERERPLDDDDADDGARGAAHRVRSPRSQPVAVGNSSSSTRAMT